MRDAPIKERREDPIARRRRGRIVRSLDHLTEAWRRYCRNALAVVGLGCVILCIAMALFAPYLAPFSPFALGSQRLAPPQASHLLGTDHLGRDILSGVLFGARTSLEVGLFSVLISVVIGILIGTLSGYYGGWVDDLLMRTTEVFQVVPRFFLALIIVAIFGPSLWGIIFVIGILSWAEIARLVRAEFLVLKARSFVTAARAYGAGNAFIIFWEILPNAMATVVVAASLQIATSILLEASLSFLGLGDPETFSWGKMLFSSQQFLREAWWTATFPGLAICLATLGVTLIADGLNDALNPRLKETG